MYSIFDNTTDKDGSAWSGGGVGGVHDTLDTSKLATFSYEFSGDMLFQDMVITTLSETHKEGEGRSDVFGDTFVSMATGAEPIGIQLAGWVVRVKGYDSRADFIDIYQKKLRGSASASAGDRLVFSLKQSVVFTLSLQSVIIREDASNPDFTNVVFTGMASNYRVIPILNSISPNTNVQDSEDSIADGSADASDNDLNYGYA